MPARRTWNGTPGRGAARRAGSNRTASRAGAGAARTRWRAHRDEQRAAASWLRTSGGTLEGLGVLVERRRKSAKRPAECALLRRGVTRAAQFVDPARRCSRATLLTIGTHLSYDNERECDAHATSRADAFRLFNPFLSMVAGLQGSNSADRGEAFGPGESTRPAIESTAATARLRTKATTGPGSKAAGKATA